MSNARTLASYASNFPSNRNLIINGDMRIDQRNAGASVSYTGTPTYSVDRWYGQGINSAGVFTLQQSTDAPASFNNSLKATVTTASTPSGTQVYRLIQRIEGFNTADLNLGTANAKALTMSFWVKSIVTGAFGGSFWGGSATAWFPFSYTINSANTWEYKTIAISAASSTPATAFNTSTGIGLQLTFNLGAASALLTTPGSWIYGATEYYGPTGQTNLIETNGATFYITGVQLEVGTVATPFEHRPYGAELSLCQRYFEFIENSNNSGDYLFPTGSTTNSLNLRILIPYKVQKRSEPDVSGYSIKTGTKYTGLYNVFMCQVPSGGNVSMGGPDINAYPKKDFCPIRFYISDSSLVSTAGSGIFLRGSTDNNTTTGSSGVSTYADSCRIEFNSEL